MSAETVPALTGMPQLLGDLARRWRPDEVIGRPLTLDEAHGVLRHVVLQLGFIAPDRLQVEAVMHCVDGGVRITYRVDGERRHRHLIPYLVQQGLRDMEAAALSARRLAALKRKGALT